MPPEPLTAVVDRITEGVATLLTDDGQIDLDASLLPTGAGEGDWLTVDCSVDPPRLSASPATTLERREELSRRLRRLGDRARRFER